jgi:hypothetical protein
MNTTPQLTLDLMMSSPVFAGVNSPRPDETARNAEAGMAGVSAELALSQMVVDDRAMRLGKTTWKHLLDIAIATGHVELYQSEEGVHGLRKPGFRFGPIARMPEIAVPYIQETLAAKKTRKGRSHE